MRKNNQEVSFEQRSSFASVEGRVDGSVEKLEVVEGKMVLKIRANRKQGIHPDQTLKELTEI